MSAATTSPAAELVVHMALVAIECARASLLARATDPSTRARIVAQLDHAGAGVRAALTALRQEEAPDAP